MDKVEAHLFLTRLLNSAAHDPWLQGYMVAKTGGIPQIQNPMTFDLPAATKESAMATNEQQIVALLKLMCEVMGIVCPIIKEM